MKHRSTTPVSKSFATRASIVAASVLMLVATPVQFMPKAKADIYDEQIAALKVEIGKYEAEASKLSQKADSLQRELDKLTNEKAQIQAQVDLSQKQHDKLVKDIAETKKRIEDNRRVSGELIVNDSLRGDVSPFIRLAGSDNLAKVFDGIAADEAAQEDILSKIDEIEKLQAKLEKDKKEVERVLLDQKSQRDQLAAKEAERANLISETKGEESAYKNLSSKRSSQVEKLRAEQAAANAAALQNSGVSGVPAGVPGGGGYPGKWANAPLDAYVDPWGLYTRECVSYTAWKVYSTGRYVPHFGGRGNANQWPSTAAAYGIPSGSTPKAGSVAVWNIGYYGHVMYVESVNSDGTITVSDYNLQWDGLYRIYNRSASGLTYVYF